MALWNLYHQTFVTCNLYLTNMHKPYTVKPVRFHTCVEYTGVKTTFHSLSYTHFVCTGKINSKIHVALLFTFHTCLLSIFHSFRRALLYCIFYK